METVDSALFAVCLDETEMKDFNECAVGMLHGNGRNRWFDKSFQLIIAKNGKAAVNFEHAWGDGVAVLRYFNSVYEDVNKTKEIDTTSEIKVNEVKFEFNDSLSNIIKEAEKEVDKSMNRLELSTLESDIFSKKFCKSNKVGADGCLQMSFQLAHYLMKGTIKATYESASTAAFKHGRTETIRSATQEAKLMVEALTSLTASTTEKKQALLKAISNHGSITKDALMGKGMDRHLFALRTIAQQQGKMTGSVGDFFNDETMQEMNHFILSTSTLSSPALQAGGFGPVNADNYGIAYGIADDAFAASVASFKLDSPQFRDNIEKAAKIIRETIETK